jgi:hypothetical protein
VQDHSFSFVVDAPRELVWRALHPPVRNPAQPGKPRVIEHGDVRIEVLHEGDEHGDGLIRHCYFRVPKYLLSGGVGQSWEWVTQVVPNVSSHYEAIGKPLWSRAEGWQQFEDTGDGRTRVSFRETYHAFNPVLRTLLERRVHRFISKDNDVLIRAAIEAALARRRG